MKRLGVIPSFFVAHVYHWGDVHVANFGQERASQISPARTALDSGVVFDFHQDSPVIPPNMVESLWCARMPPDEIRPGAGGKPTPACVGGAAGHDIQRRLRPL